VEALVELSPAWTAVTQAKAATMERTRSFFMHEIHSRNAGRRQASFSVILCLGGVCAIPAFPSAARNSFSRPGRSASGATVGGEPPSNFDMRAFDLTVPDLTFAMRLGHKQRRGRL
jgi:hypothetical protein